MKKEFCKNIDYFLRYFAIPICKQIFPTFSYTVALNLRAESEKVNKKKLPYPHRGDVLKRFDGSPITNAT